MTGPAPKPASCPVRRCGPVGPMRVGCKGYCLAFEECLTYDESTPSKSKRAAWRATIIRNPHGVLVLPHIFHSSSEYGAKNNASNWCLYHGVSIKKKPSKISNIKVEKVDVIMDMKHRWREMSTGDRAIYLKSWHILPTEILIRDWTKLPREVQILLQVLWDLRELVK